jgi:hypothetical protein
VLRGRWGRLWCRLREGGGWKPGAVKHLGGSSAKGLDSVLEVEGVEDYGAAARVPRWEVVGEESANDLSDARLVGGVVVVNEECGVDGGV